MLEGIGFTFTFPFSGGNPSIHMFYKENQYEIGRVKKYGP
jgi:hypothetical protein